MEEIAKLQEQFQLAQLTTAKQKLSERNVIEIVNKLVELGLLEVIYTVDGKEYLTPQELVKEIKDELLVHGGRINLVELSQILNIDLSHIEGKVPEILGQDRNISFVLGQLVTRGYLDQLAEEVNDKLQEKGHVSIPELTKLYDLPADFLSENLNTRLGTIVKGKVDSYDKDVIFTDAFITRMRAQIRGIFSAVTRPIQFGSVIQSYKFKERIFFSILEELVANKRVAGVIVGGHNEKSTYVPDIYTKSQNEWVDSFYKQNGYLEYDALSRLGITDPKGFLQKRYKSEPLVYLSTCCAGRGLQDQIEACVEEAMSAESWVDIMPLLPSVFNPHDANHLLTACLKHHPGALICCDTIIASEKLISHCSTPFPDLMAKKAQKDTLSHPAFRPSQSSGGVAKPSPGEGNTKEDRKEQRKKKQTTGSGSTKSGGGTQGREIKTKAVKKKGYKGRGGEEAESDEEAGGGRGKSRADEIEFMGIEEIEEVLRGDNKLKDCPEELLTEIAQQLIRPLTKQYQEVAKSIFLESTGAATGSSRKKTHGELQEKLTGLWTNARMYEKGLKLLPEDLQPSLVQHLMRTVCTDILNLVLNTVALEQLMSVSDETKFTPESRSKLISKLVGDEQTIMMKLNSSVSGKNLDEFFSHLENLCSPQHLGVMLKKPDKKREKQLTFNHRQALCDQLTSEVDAAMTLHLACVILFQKFTQNMLHLPGKCVPQLLAFLKDHLLPEHYQELIALQANHLLMTEREKGVVNARSSLIQHLHQEGSYPGLGLLKDGVIAQLTRQQTECEGQDTPPSLEENINKVKEIAMTTKKSVLATAAED